MREHFIVHVDMDAFFAAVEQRDNPDLRGKPVIIGADPKNGKGRGVVSTCSYEARKFGLHSAMPISQAWRLCPKGVYLRPDFEKYSAVSKRILEVFLRFTPDIEQISIDEAFLDITKSYKLFATPARTCELIKKEIKKETGLICSVGLAPSRLVAKIASDFRKPDGLVIIKEGEVERFLAPLDILKVWGIGPKTAAVLRSKGINKVADIFKADKNILDAVFSSGFNLKTMISGGETNGEKKEKDKSLSCETTFSNDLSDDDKIKSVILGLSDKLSSRLRKSSLKGRTFTLKIRLEDFLTYTRSYTLDFATNYSDVIYHAVLKLYGGFQRKRKKVRLLGLKASKLISSDIQEYLFEDKSDTKREKIHKALDNIREKFGENSIYKAGGDIAE